MTDRKQALRQALVEDLREETWIGGDRLNFEDSKHVEEHLDASFVRYKEQRIRKNIRWVRRGIGLSFHVLAFSLIFHLFGESSIRVDFAGAILLYASPFAMAIGAYYASLKRKSTIYRALRILAVSEKEFDNAIQWTAEVPQAPRKRSKGVSLAEMQRRKEAGSTILDRK